MTKAELNAAMLLAVVAACVVAAVTTAFWIGRVGLFAPRAPLSALGTAIRIGLVAAAVSLLFVRRGRLERCALLLSVVAAGSSALWGLGVDRPAIRAVRLLSHVGAYAGWGITAFRKFQATRRGIEAPLRVANGKL